MTGQRTFPWAADRSPVRAPEGEHFVVAAHPVADVRDVHRAMTEHLGPMSDSCMASLGHGTIQTASFVPPVEVYDAKRAVARLQHYRDEHQAVEVNGYRPSDAVAQLLAWQAEGAEHPALVLLALGGHAGRRAAALS